MGALADTIGRRLPSTRLPPEAAGDESMSSAAKRQAIETFSGLMDSAPVAAFAKDADGRYVYANPYFLSTMGAHMGPDWRGKTDSEMWPPAAAAIVRAHDWEVLSGGGAQVFSYQMRSKDKPHTVLLIEFALSSREPRSGIGGFAIDLTASAQARSKVDRLAVAVDHAVDSIMMVDLDGCIRDVNVAFERVTGYRRDEVIGQNPRLLKSGLHPATFYEDMWAKITAGGQWVGEMVDRRKDGTFFIVETVMSPVRDAAGTVEGFVSVQTDVTERRALAAQSAISGAERTLVLDGVSGLSTNSSLEANAQAICRTVASLSGVAAAQMVVFESSSQAMPIGQVVTGREDPPLRYLSFQISRRLHAQSASGVWIEPWEDRQGRAYNQLVENTGPCALACAPVLYGKQLVGLLTVQSIDVTNKGAVNELLPVIVEFAAVAGGVLGSQMAQRIDARSGREHISEIVKRHAYSPVFQPIVDFVLHKVVGYEALTRFADGSNPETLFAEANEVHLGIELESATLHAALAAAKALPSNVWLNINASPELILDGGQLRFLISGIRRPLVVEVTEHTAIVDYPGFRTAMAALGPGTRLAVDDAGSGFAGLRHILELRPAFLKLDRWLVAGLESDEARQAMIFGLGHFARKTGCLLIAEGIETEREIQVLRSLDVHLGQGYALGKPEAVEAATARASAPVAAGHR